MSGINRLVMLSVLVFSYVYVINSDAQSFQSKLSTIVNSWTLKTDITSFTNDLTEIIQVSKEYCGNSTTYKPSNTQLCSFVRTVEEYSKIYTKIVSSSNNNHVIAIVDLKQRLANISLKLDVDNSDTLSDAEILNSNIEPYRPIPSFSSKLSSDSLTKLKLNFREIEKADIDEFASELPQTKISSSKFSKAQQQMIDEETKYVDSSKSEYNKKKKVEGKCDKNSLESYVKSDSQYIQLENECRTSSMSACYCAAVKLTQLYWKYKIDFQCPMSEQEKSELERVINENRKNALTMGRNCP